MKDRDRRKRGRETASKIYVYSGIKYPRSEFARGEFQGSSCPGLDRPLSLFSFPLLKLYELCSLTAGVTPAAG